MKPIVLRFCLICICLCATCWTSKAAANNAFFRADSFESRGDFAMAAVWFEKAAFQSSHPLQNSQAIFRRGLCFKKMARYAEAVTQLDRIVNFNLPDSLCGAIHYESTLCAYLAGDYDKAAFLVMKPEPGSLSLPFQKKILILSILIHNQRAEFEDAKNDCRMLAKLSQQNINVDSLFALKPHLLKPGKARMMSTLFPGLGQAYTGYYGGAGMGFLFTTSALAFGAFQIYEGNYFRGFATGLGLFQRFYFGGITRAGYLAEIENKERIQEFNMVVYKEIKGEL